MFNIKKSSYQLVFLKKRLLITNILSSVKFYISIKMPGKKGRLRFLKNYNRFGIESLFPSDSFSRNIPLKDSPTCLLSANIKE